MKSTVIPQTDRDQREDELPEELPPRAEVEVVVEDTEHGRQRAADQQRDEGRGVDRRRDVDEIEPR